MIGDSGTGRSHLLIALGTEAVLAGFRVRDVLAAKLVNELVELLHFLDDWLTVDHERLDTSLRDFVGNRAYGISQLRTGLDRFVFLLGGDHTGHVFDPPRQ